ncbi:MAG TPA: IS1182 family transposase [Baekduia sp.]|nr:IS1182 family transposase [Baekduia sp.]
MLTAASGQVGMFDAAVLCEGMVPRDSFYGLLAEHGHRIVRDEDFAECYSAGRGRPSIPPSLLAKVLLLQLRTGLSDEGAMEALRFDLRWKLALGLAIDHGGFHPTTLTKFRARLLLHGKERLALENTLRLAEELGLLDGPVEQLIDATPMLGAAATQDTVRLVRHGVRRLLDAVAATDATTSERLAAGLEFDYARPGDKPDCRWRAKGERERMLTRVAQDAERALRAVEQVDALTGDEQVAAAAGLLRELIGQDFDIDAGGIPRLHHGTRPDRVLSVVDPQMRHGRKSPQRRFDGFKLHAVATNTKAPLVTGIAVTPANLKDGQVAPTLIASLPEQRRPKRLLGDAAYGHGPIRAALADCGVEVLAHRAGVPTRGSQTPKADFAIDCAAGTVTCPHGRVAQITTQPSGQRSARFSETDCRACPLKSRCVPTLKARRILIQPEEEHLQAGQRALADPQLAEHLRRTRPRIERLLSLIAQRYHARRSRYLGTAKATLQAAWTAALVNLHPLAAALTT